MYHAIVRLLLSACGLGLADYLLDGVRVDHFSTLFWAGLLLGIANAIVRPILIFFTLPITLLTLGFFLLVINAAMLGLVAWLLSGFYIDGFWTALWAWFIIAFTQAIGSVLLKPKKIEN